jgi:1-acyl-sn-glycerol-3-phosphate acyltransferase
MRFFYFIAQNILKAIFTVFYGLKVLGDRRATIPPPVLLASNHQSSVDPLVVGAVTPVEMAYFAKEEIFGWFLLKDLARLFNAFPVKRGGFDLQAIRHAGHVLKKGLPMVIFPEGTRSKTGKLQEGKAGIGMLAFQNNVDIVPVHVHGTFRLRRSFLKWPGIVVHFGPRISIEEFKKLGGSKKEVYNAISERVMKEIARLRDETLATIRSH